jgi:hypothetical protein
MSKSTRLKSGLQSFITPRGPAYPTQEQYGMQNGILRIYVGPVGVILFTWCSLLLPYVIQLANIIEIVKFVVDIIVCSTYVQSFIVNLFVHDTSQTYL